MLHKKIDDYIQKKFIEEPYKLSLSKEIEDYTKNRLTPLEIKAKIQRYVSGSKAGRYDMYLELNKIASEKPEYPEYAEDIKTALSDIFFYFDAEMINEGRTLGDPISVLPIQLSVDEAIRTYYLDKRDMQESAVNTLAKLGSETCIYDLCESIEKHNLRVIVRIIRTLRILTGINFGTLDIDGVKTWWLNDTNKKKYKSCYKEYIEALTYMESKSSLNNKDIEHVISLLDETIKMDAEALCARCLRASMLTSLRQDADAEKEFNEVEKLNKNYRWLFYYKAFLLLQQDKKEDAIKSLKKAISISPSIKENIIKEPKFNDILEDLQLKQAIN